MFKMSVPSGNLLQTSPGFGWDGPEEDCAFQKATQDDQDTPQSKISFWVHSSAVLLRRSLGILLLPKKGDVAKILKSFLPPLVPVKD
jgi:hypothetical protein